MATARFRHTATLLLDGRVLIAGGDGGGATPAGRGAELYDPATGRFVATGSLIRPRVGHSATRLASGQVLIVGGWFEKTAEIYDPSTGTFSLTGEMLAQQDWHVAAALANGKVLIAGNADAELYDPATGHFVPAGRYAPRTHDTLPYPQFMVTATLLADGRVLLVGDEPVQLYDPSSNTFSVTGSFGNAVGVYGLELHSATLLGNGRVLIAGGMSEEVWPLGLVAAAELYDPATGAFKATSAMHAPRDSHAAVLLPDGKVLIAGGYSANCDDAFRCGGNVASAELYDPSSGTFTAAGNMSKPRAPTATLLKNGDVLITGGPDVQRRALPPKLFRALGPLVPLVPGPVVELAGRFRIGMGREHHAPGRHPVRDLANLRRRRRRDVAGDARRARHGL
jgi:hypothetical protein